MRWFIYIEANRGFEQVPTKQPVIPYVQRSLVLTKFYRENFANDAQYDQIIMKLTQLITAFCHHTPFRKLIHSDLHENNLLQHFIQDVEVHFLLLDSAHTQLLSQRQPKDKQRWFYSAELLFEMRTDMRRDLINDEMWGTVESGVVMRRQQIQARLQANRMRAQTMAAQHSQNEYYHHPHWQGHGMGENEYMYNMQQQNPHHMHGSVIVSQNENTPLTPPMTPMSQQQTAQQHHHQQQQQHMQQQQPVNYQPSIHNMHNSQQHQQQQPTPNSNYDGHQQNQPLPQGKVHH